MVPGSAAADAPIVRPDGSPTWLLRELGDGFTALVMAGDESDALVRSIEGVAANGIPLKVVRLASGGNAGDGLVDGEGLAAQRYDLRPGTVYLFRPDQHVCARWRKPTATQIRSAVKRALAIA